MLKGVDTLRHEAQGADAVDLVEEVRVEDQAQPGLALDGLGLAIDLSRVGLS